MRDSCARRSGSRLDQLLSPPPIRAMIGNSPWISFLPIFSVGRLGSCVTTTRRSWCATRVLTGIDSRLTMLAQYRHADEALVLPQIQDGVLIVHGREGHITRICSLMWFCHRLGKMNSSQNGTSGRVISRGLTGGVPSS